MVLGFGVEVGIYQKRVELLRFRKWGDNLCNHAENFLAPRMDAAMCAKGATMCSKDAAMCAKNAVMYVKNAASCAKDVAMYAKNAELCAKEAAMYTKVAPMSAKVAVMCA